MIAGTLGTLNPVDEPLDSWKHSGDYPALQVTTSQATHGDGVAQSGRAAARVKQSVQDVHVGTDQAGEVRVETSRDEQVVAFATDVYADVTGAGVVLAESVDDATEELPFPFDLVTVRTGSEVQRQAIDVTDLYHAWDDEGDLGDVWMSGTDEHGTAINYHGQAAASDAPPSIGLGFERPWGGTVMKGVVYESGYVALYSARAPSKGLQFVAEELLPHTRVWDPDEQVDQADFDDFGGGD